MAEPASSRQQFPNLGAPVVSPEGLLTQEWRQFFAVLWARSGSAIGGLDIKTGTMLPFAGSAVPEGYLLCDGRAVKRIDYPNLYAVIGTTWGAGESGTFNLPDSRERSLLGATTGDFALGSSGGIKDLALAVENLPVHSHEVDDPGHTHGATTGAHTHTVIDPGHVHTAAVPDSLGTAGAAAGAAAGNTGSATTGITLGDATGSTTIDSATTGIELETTGEGKEFSVQNKYIAVLWMIKT